MSDANGLSTDLVVTTDFTLANVGRIGLNGSLTLVNSGQAWLTGTGKLKTGYTLYVKFSPDASQPMKGRDWGQFAPEKFERTLDRLAMNIKAIKAIADKAIVLQVGASGSGILPPLAGNAGKILQVNSTADGFEYGVTSSTIAGYASSASSANSSAQTAKTDAQTAQAAAEAAEASALAYKNSALTYKNQASSSAADALAAELGAATSETNAAASAVNAENAKNTAVTKAAEAAASALAASTAEGFKNQAETFKNQAGASATASANSATTSSTSATNSANSATAANASKLAALQAKVDAEAARDASAVARDASLNSALQSELFSNLQHYTRKQTITIADSPFVVDQDLHQDTLFFVDDSGGDINILLPPIGDLFDQATFKIGLYKMTASHLINIFADGTDTITGNPSQTLSQSDLGSLIYPGSPVDWKLKYFLSVIAAESNILPGGILTFGDPATDGSWRIAKAGSQLKFQQRQSGLWVDSDVLNPPA